jgi:hypothetical protein
VPTVLATPAVFVRELDRIALIQAPETLALDGGEVNPHVVRE